MVYRGNESLIHLSDGTRESVGEHMADSLDHIMRGQAIGRGENSVYSRKLCPGCYIPAVLAMAFKLAKDNGQSESELVNSLIATLQQRKDPEHCTIVQDETFDAYSTVISNLREEMHYNRDE